IIILDGTLANVYTGEFLRGKSIAIKGERIAYIGKDPTVRVGPNTRVIDAKGMFLIPGFIDPHTHCDTFQTPSEISCFALLHGTTAIITEIFSITNALGLTGAKLFLKQLKKQALHIFAVAPTISYLRGNDGHGHRVITAEEMRELLKEDQIVGMGEVSWPYVVDYHEELLELIGHTLSLGKYVEGHSAGARGRKLLAYLSAGVGSCHESTSEDEVWEKLRLGMWTFIREGSIRKELPGVKGIAQKGIDLRRLGLASDTILPSQLVKEGYMDRVVERAIDMGFPPMQALQMATINPAQRFGLERIIGGIAPGRSADIAIIPDLHNMQPLWVIARGKVAVEEGRLALPLSKDKYPTSVRQVFARFPVFVSEGFCLPVKGKTRVISIEGEVFTKEDYIELSQEMRYQGDPQKDILLSSVINRHNPQRSFTGLVKGFGLKCGGVASSISFDTSDIIAVAATAHDMAAAVNRVVELGGGIVVHAQGNVLAELSLPIAGVESDLSLEKIAIRLEKIQKALWTLGSRLLNPLLALRTLTYYGVPHLRMADDGYYHVSRGEKVGLQHN
ncbi:MAG: adenine deaminase, partial [Deltaproteobacteria bacterium]